MELDTCYLPKYLFVCLYILLEETGMFFFSGSFFMNLVNKRIGIFFVITTVKS